MTDRPERAVIAIPTGDDHDRWTRICHDYCTAAGYEITAIIYLPDGWPGAMALLLGLDAEVVVVAARDHLPRDRIPRLEVVNEQSADRRQPPGQRRPRRI